jgi:DNA-binding NarL/FixJ family response regulator
LNERAVSVRDTDVCPARPRPEGERLRVLLADDHEVVRQGVRELLRERSCHVCCEARDGREAVALAAEDPHDLAILDLTMPGLSGLDAAEEIVRASPGTEVLIYTAHDSPDLVRRALARGAHAVVLKTDGAAQLLSAVDALARHEKFLSPGLTGVWLDAAAPAPELSARRLTPRELEIVRLLAEGKSNWCVGTILGISVRTVETHRSKIMSKLNLESIVELVHYAIRRGMVEP